MKAVEVELAGTSPLLMNHRVWDGIDQPTDLDRAASKLYYAGKDVVIPAGHILWAIVCEGIARRDDLIWPRGWNAIRSSSWLTSTDAVLSGDWTVHKGEKGYWVYPRFDAWTARFTLTIDEAHYPAELIRELLTAAGEILGLPTYAAYAGPGNWGRYAVTEWSPADVARVEMATA